MAAAPSKKRVSAVALILALLLLIPAGAWAAEGDPLLSVDDLISLEGSYEAFLSELEELLVDRGLLSGDERAAWHDAQMGDFYQNGGYGSLLISYLPGMLSYVREEDTLLTLRAPLQNGLTLELNTMRRYTPQDSSLSGLMLTLSLENEAGTPQDALYTFSATSGIFLKWDALSGVYVSVGTTAVSEGETVVWSDQTPVADARNPVITIDLVDAATQQPLPGAVLTLTVDGNGYLVNDGALLAE